MEMTNLNVTYKNHTKFFTCCPEDIQREIEARFKIDLRNMDIYAVQKSKKLKIKPSDIKDVIKLSGIKGVMKFEIVEKDALVTNGNRTLRSSLASIESLRDNIITKLKKNYSLTGTERQALIEWLESEHSPINLGKRKRSDGDDNSDKVTRSKMVQVNISISNTKDFFTQTDSVTTEADRPKEPENISQKMKRLFYTGNPTAEETSKFMDDTFNDRRKFILLEIPHITLIKDKYPMLFSFEEVMNELSRLFFSGVCEQFIKNMGLHSKSILDLCDFNDDIVLRTTKSFDRAQTEKQKLYARIVGSVFAVSKILKEDFNFIRLLDNPHGSKENYPYIDASWISLKDVFFDTSKYYVKVEGEQFCEVPTFLEAVMCLLAAFFIFNIQYPENCRQTLIVFEKLYLCANDTTDMDDQTSQIIKTCQVKAKK